MYSDGILKDLYNIPVGFPTLLPLRFRYQAVAACPSRTLDADCQLSRFGAKGGRRNASSVQNVVGRGRAEGRK